MKNFGEIHKADALLRLQMWQERCKDVKIKKGDFVQVMLRDKNGSEHAWCEVTNAHPEMKDIQVRIDNDLVVVSNRRIHDIIFINRDEIESHMRDIELGDIVIVRQAFLGEPAGVLAYVYQVYPDFDNKDLYGVSLITENGVNLGGFSKEEQFLYLKDPIASNLKYVYTSDFLLDQHFEEQIKPLFKA